MPAHENKALETYLQDHLAGATHAIDLLGFLVQEHPTDGVGNFASEILAEVEADHKVLLKLIDDLGWSESRAKNTAAWISEKLNRLKLGDGGSNLGTFEAFEFLVLGIHGKRSLWMALSAGAESNARLRGLDFARLIERAESQESRVDSVRLLQAKTVFAENP